MAMDLLLHLGESLLVTFSVFFFFFFLIRFASSHGFFYWCRSIKLPPGSMGWPYVGQTLQLYSQHPNAFFSSKQKRYGEIFKTHILGCPCVMMASPDAAKLVLVSHAPLFRPTFPASKMALIGARALFFHDGPYHARLRRLVVSAFAPDSIRRVIPDAENLAVATLESWPSLQESHGSVNTFAEMKKFTFKVGMIRIFGSLENLDVDALDLAYATLEKGYNSMPLNVPGTKYYESMKARRQLHDIIQGIIRERRKNNIVNNDFLGTLMMHTEVDDNGDGPISLSDEQIVDNIIGVIFASRDTTASALTWIIKFLKSNPHLLRSIIDEHERIQHAKVEEGKEQFHLTWEDTKNMQLTSRVIQETLRIVTILSFTFREAVEDVEYKGYIIPKGWKVLPLFRNIHHNPEFFEDPLKFDPTRFEVQPKPNTFMPFGSGAHSCPGSELAKLEMLIFIHHLTTKLRWELDESKTGVQYSPFQVPQEGLPIRVEMRRDHGRL